MPPKPKKNSESLSQRLRSPSADLLDSDAELSKNVLPLELQTFMTSIITAFTSSFNSCVDRIVDALDKKLSHQLDSQSVEIFDLSKRMDRLEKANKDLLSEISDLKDANKTLLLKSEVLDQSLDDLEQYSKGSNILIHGFPLQTPTHGGPETN